MRRARRPEAAEGEELVDDPLKLVQHRQGRVFVQHPADDDAEVEFGGGAAGDVGVGRFEQPGQNQSAGSEVRHTWGYRQKG